MLTHYLTAAISFAVTLFWFKSLPLAIFSFLVHIFLDADHLVDYWLANGFNLDYKRFVKETFDGGRYFVKSQKIIVPLHSWELLLFILVAVWALNIPQFGIAFALGFLPHLLWDQKTYAKRPLMYFFVFRAFKRFGLEEICGV